jgi:hypothetical protein
MDHRAYENWIMPTLFIGYFLGFIFCNSIPIKENLKILSIPNIITSFFIWIISSAPSLPFIFIMIGFSSDSSSAYETFSYLSYPFIYGFIGSLPCVIIKFIIYCILHTIKSYKERRIINNT